MANEFQHKSIGAELTQSEFESVGGHILDSQAIGDLIYATTTTQLSRLGIGATGAVLTVTGGVPAWDTTWTPTGHLIPAADDSYDLGSAAAAWQDLYLEGDISLTDAGSISTAAGALTIGSAAAINITPTAGSAILLDGTISIDAGVVTGATSITSTAFAGALTGNVTGNASGTAATVTSGTQAAITTLANVVTVGELVNGSIADGFGTINNGSNTITTTGLVTAGALTVNGTTTLNGALVLGDAAADTLTINATLQGATPLVFEGANVGGDNLHETSFAIVDPTADRTITFPDATLTVNAAANISGTTLASNVVTSSLTTVGALGSGSIGTGFGVINTAAAITGTVITASTNFAGALTGNVTGNADTVTTNANLTGHVISSGNAATLGSFTQAQLMAALGTNTILVDADIGSTVQAYDADLLALAGIGTAVQGDIIYSDSNGSWARLVEGTDGHVLTLASGVPSWAAAAAGYSDAEAIAAVEGEATLVLAGDVEIADSKFIEFASAAGTPTTDNSVQGVVIEFLAAEAITQFDAVYVSTTTGRVGRALATDAAKMPVIGIAIETQGSAGSSVRVLIHGVYRDDGGFGADMTVGAKLYAPEALGTLTTTMPTTTGDLVQTMGVAVGVRSAFINPSMDIIEHA